jgi:hypothetical protein
VKDVVNARIQKEKRKKWNKRFSKWKLKLKHFQTFTVFSFLVSCFCLIWVSIFLLYVFCFANSVTVENFEGKAVWKKGKLWKEGILIFFILQYSNSHSFHVSMVCTYSVFVNLSSLRKIKHFWKEDVWKKGKLWKAGIQKIFLCTYYLECSESCQEIKEIKLKKIIWVIWAENKGVVNLQNILGTSQECYKNSTH